MDLYGTYHPKIQSYGSIRETVLLTTVDYFSIFQTIYRMFPKLHPCQYDLHCQTEDVHQFCKRSPAPFWERNNNARIMLSWLNFPFMYHI